ncbi:MAG: amylo-alpha-1,6-glucosidase [Nanoarchaeota archaeon]|nr:amylo-alpha-1,6-glucosidase [Nanoarchaeota archaeon]
MKEHVVEKDLNQNAFLLTNRHGGYALFSGRQISRFFGLYFNSGFRMFKILENIIIKDSSELVSLKLDNLSAERKRSDGVHENFFMPFGRNALVYELSSEKDLEFVFDIRESYDNRNFGRYYNISRFKNKIVISYTKKKDYRDYNGNAGAADGKNQGEDEYTVHACIAFPDENFYYEKAEQWFPVEYDMDKKRNSSPWGKYVFNAFSAKTSRCVVSFGSSRKEAISEADYVLSNLDNLKLKQREFYISYSLRKKILHENQLTAFKFSLNAVHNLSSIIDDSAGIYAGLPWFFQFWSRDEAISLQALFLSGALTFSKDVVMRQLEMIDDKGFLFGQYPKNSIVSADALGWLCKRIHQNLHKFSNEEKEIIYSKIKSAADLLFKNSTSDCIAFNHPKTTWMDTDFKGDSRAGARIEIQAMRLIMYRLLHDLSVNDIHKKFYSNLEQKTKQKVKDAFWNGKYLKDGADDETIRPNVFIAYYIYPELLGNLEWKICFENCLKALWLDWGGISSIDKKSHLFCDTHTGEDPRSYHRGDSWYWINNLAALCMFKLDKEMFAKNIHAILDASTREILNHGAIGYHAELSSAKEQKSQGCLAQAWSSAMFVELVDEMFK